MSKHNLSESQVREAREKFDLHDKDKSGGIDMNELKPLLEETLKNKLSENLFNRYTSTQFNATDKNNDGQVSFEEFLSLFDKLYNSNELPISIKPSAIPKRPQLESPSTNSPKVVKQADKLTEEQKQQARVAFDKYDNDKSGHISKDELKQILQETLRSKNMGNLIFERLVNSHLQQADSDNSGEVDFNEFLSIYAQIFEKNSQ
jgi:Ca2+-binding EF-hand superfamily protein